MEGVQAFDCRAEQARIKRRYLSIVAPRHQLPERTANARGPLLAVRREGISILGIRRAQWALNMGRCQRRGQLSALRAKKNTVGQWRPLKSKVTRVAYLRAAHVQRQQIVSIRHEHVQKLAHCNLQLR